MNKPKSPLLKKLAMLMVLFSTAGIAGATWSSGTGAGQLPAADPARVAVTGISSGAFMATQVQLAYPELFPRAAMLAGGPYDCAVIVRNCLAPSEVSDTQMAYILDRVKTNVSRGLLGNPGNLQNGIAYVLYGTSDNVVGTAIAGSVTQFYKKLQLIYDLKGLAISEDIGDFGHTFPTYLSPPNLPVNYPLGHDDCRKPIAPYLGHCNFDAAKAILQHLYPEASAGEEPADTSGALLTVDASTLGETAGAFIDDKAYAYVPSACNKDGSCGLLVVLHGCNQSRETIGETFVRNVGFNRWAADYHVIVVYPQTQVADGNYGGCWDWLGYTGENFDTRLGPQMRFIADIVKGMAQR